MRGEEVPAVPQVPAEGGAPRQGLESSTYLLAAFTVGKKSEVRVSLDRLGERWFLNARLWWKNRHDEWHPSTRGVTFERDEFERLAGAVQQAIKLMGAK